MTGTDNLVVIVPDGNLAGRDVLYEMDEDLPFPFQKSYWEFRAYPKMAFSKMTM